MLLPKIINAFRQSSLRKVLKPVERWVKGRAFRSSRILFGPLRGCIYQGQGEGAILGTYELLVQTAISKYTRPGDVFYDIGANHGYFSMLASKRAESNGVVYAFEPLPYNIEVFHRVMKDNHIQNVHLVPLALSNCIGETELYVGDGRVARPSLYPWRGDEHVVVKTITLDEFIRSHPPPTVVKMDVEGAESLILQGASELLSGSKSPRTWIVELHTQEQERECTGILERSGYAIRPLRKTQKTLRQFPYHIVADQM